MIRYAKSQGFAIPQMNINGLIWIEGVLQAAENMQSQLLSARRIRILPILVATNLSYRR